MRAALQSRQWLILVGCILMTLGIDYLDSTTSEEYELFVLYFIPVAVATWYCGKPAGLFVSVMSALTWFESDIFASHTNSIAVASWDTFERLASFMALSLALSLVKNELMREKKLNGDLSEAMKQIRQLQGILPMCSFCRRIRDPKQHWVPFETYIAEHSDAKVSHGLCPTCYKRHYGEADGT
jgi:hypothetical protein